jgi:hypothetical protein
VKNQRYSEFGVHREKPVSLKIKTLIGEGVPQKQAVAEALAMQRAGRLTKSGGYRRVKKKDYVE